MSTEPVIRLDDVSRLFRSRGKEIIAAANVSFDVHPREFFTIVGPSGCGKSTILNMIVGLLQPTSGRVLFRGEPITGITKRIGYVTQEPNLFPWRTLENNVMFGMEARGVDVEERRQRAADLIKRVGLEGFEDRYPHELSGGMKARVNIARTLAWKPEVILMDEPFGPLDVQTRLQLQNLLLDLWQQEESTIIFITHDLGEAVSLSDRVLVMTRHPGTVKSTYQVELPRPRDVFSIQTSAEFRKVFDPLWDLLKTEMQGQSEAARREVLT